MCNQDVIAAVKAVIFCRMVVYPAVQGWCEERVQLEVADELSALGHTDGLRGAGYWLVIDMTPEQVAEEVERLRGCGVGVKKWGGGKSGVSSCIAWICPRR